MKRYEIIIEDYEKCNIECWGLIEAKTCGICIVFDGVKLGRASTLCAARVPEEKLEKFVGAVNAYSGVTHNYLRNNDYNVWFTLNAVSRKEIDLFLAQLKEKTGVTDILDMRAVRTFKIDAAFEV